MNRRNVVLMGVVAAVLLAAPYLLSPYHATLAIPIFAYGIALLGLNLLFGYTGLLSFGHALFIAIGAYTVATLGSKLGIGSFELQFAAAVVAAGVVAVPLGLLAVRYSKIFFSMLTLAFGMIFHSFLFKFYAITGGESGIVISRPSLLGAAWDELDKTAFLTGPFYYYALAIGVVAVWIMYRAVHSPLGLALRAIRDNPQKAGSLGINVRRGQFIAFVVSAVYGGAGGALVGVSIGLADPELTYWTQSGNMVFMIILGGFGHFVGPLVGVTVFVFLQDWLMSGTQYWRFALGAILGLLVIAAPTGLVGILSLAYERVAGKRMRQT